MKQHILLILQCKAKNWEEFKNYIHGTHVAGIIAAKFNGRGINGVAPNCKLFGVDVLDKKGDTVLTSVFETIFQKATELAVLVEVANCRVINYSRGISSTTEEGDRIDIDKIMDSAKSEGEKLTGILRRYLDEKYDFLIVTSAGNHSDRDARYNSGFNFYYR